MSYLSSQMNSSIVIARSNGVAGYRWPDYVAFVLTSLGISTNIVNILVLLQLKGKDLSYRYMLAKAIIVFLFFFFALLSEMFTYCVVCPLTLTYSANVYSIAVTFYLISSLNFMRVLIENMISLRILSILLNRVWCAHQVSNTVVISLIVVVSVIYYVERPFCYQIVFVPSLNLYYLAYTNFGVSRGFQAFSIAKEMVRTILTVVVLTVINVINLIQFRKRFQHHVKRQIDLAHRLSSKNAPENKSTS